MSDFALVPLGQKRVSLFKGPIFWLDELCSLKSIEAEDLGVVKGRAQPHVADQIAADTKCLYIKLDGVAAPDAFCLDAVHRVEYTLNGLRRSGIVCPEHVMFFKRTRRKSLSKVSTIGSYGVSQQKFYLKLGTDKTSVSGLFKVSGKATASEPKLLFTLNRFNQAVRRQMIEDRIVDLSIAIESLLGAQTEISYQFALFSSLAATNDNGRRSDYFEKFKTLYKARSGIAHGSGSTAVAPVVADIDVYEGMCRNVVNYAIFWLAQGKKMSDLSLHLKKMALGVDAYYVPGA